MQGAITSVLIYILFHSKYKFTQSYKWMFNFRASSKSMVFNALSILPIKTGEWKLISVQTLRLTVWSLFIGRIFSAMQTTGIGQPFLYSVIVFCRLKSKPWCKTTKLNVAYFLIFTYLHTVDWLFIRMFDTLSNLYLLFHLWYT